MKNILLLCVSFLISYAVAAQSVNIKGNIIGNDDQQPLVGATVQLINVKDTTQKQFQMTNIEGQFNFKVEKPSFYTLQISFIGYVTNKKFLRVGSTDMDAGVIFMETDAKMLSAVEVQGKVQTAVINGDTTSFNASAYKTNPDASTEDLLKKLPGMIIDGSGVQAQGEQVQRVLIDGREFFSNDPAAAVKNLPADVVERIEVFDQLSDQAQFSGFNDGNTTKTINIITKQEFRNGTFGRLYAGGGTDERYSAGGNINFFEDKTRVSIVGISNNINQQNFSAEDLTGVASTSGSRRGGRGGRGGNGSVNNFLVGQQNGISSTNAFGVNYVDEWGKKIKVSGSYFLNQSENDQISMVNRETFLTNDSSQFYQENSVSNSINWNHRFNMRLTYEIDPNNSIIFTPRVSLQQIESTQDLLGSNSQLNFGEINRTTNDFISENLGINLRSNLLYRHRFAKRGRTISLNVSNTWNNSTGESRLNAQNLFFTENTSSDTLNQFTDNKSFNRSLGTDVTYSEPLSEKVQAQFSYRNSFSWNDANQKTFDQSKEANFNVLDTALSNQFESTFNTHSFNTGLSINSKKLRGRVGVAYQYAALKSEQIFPVAFQGERTFNNILPSVFLRYTISKEKNLRFIYRTRTNEPSIRQLQNVIDNSNPLNLTTGNPNLNQAVNHLFITRYSATNLEKGTSLFAYIFMQTATNYISNATTIASTPVGLAEGITLNRGAQITAPVNVNGYWSARSLITYTVPSKLIKSNITFSTGVNFNRTPGFINNEKNIAENYNLNQGLTLASNISEKIDFNVSVNANYNIVDNSLQPELNNNYFQNNTAFNLNLILGKSFVIRQNISHQLYRGLAEEFNQDFILWNMSLAKKFLKDNRGELALSIFDLLKQNININREVTGTFIQDTQTNNLQQYYMLKFTYNLRQFKQSEVPDIDRNFYRGRN